MSGIQDFIYTISSDKALKNLRARSFYLDIMMEHLVDTVLSKIRAVSTNCIYCGGGHAYLLLPNTESAKEKIEELKVKQPMVFGLVWHRFIRCRGYTACSANDLKNEPEGSYSQMFRRISNHISSRKMARYTPQQIMKLNRKIPDQSLRECAVCRRTDLLGDDDRCTICSGLERFSKAIQTKAFFAVTQNTGEGWILPLPNGCYLVAEDENGLRKRMQEDKAYLRSYCKNKYHTGFSLATHIWVGDYENGSDFHVLADGAEGVRRLAVLRADVDNLDRLL